MKGRFCRVYLPNEPKPIASMFRGGWFFLKRDLATHFDCIEDAVDSFDVYWGGEHDDENSIDVITVDGKVVASFDRPLTDDELVAIYASSSNPNLRAEARA